ncbi:hypothetical protein HA402_009792 [Bradysia odoriphaga]|nr:hypothetical protein HA402_009792 [Bradysia odoriphaga]
MFHLYWLALVGFAYVPTVVYGDNHTKTMASSDTGKPDNYTIVVLGANVNNAVVLVSLLSDDGHLVVQISDDEVTIVNPSNAAWIPDPKYIVFDEVQPENIAKRLSELTKPFRFIVAFDAGDMFADPFWKMIIYLAKYVSEDEIYTNQLRVVAMNMPHDEISLQQHCDELKLAIKNGLQPHCTVDFEMTGMHIIEKSGPVSKMSELKQELVAVKNAVDLPVA